MSTVTLHGDTIHTTERTLPAPGTKAAAFTLVKSDLSEISLADLAGKKVLLNIFPSLDTPVCATSIRRFNQEAASVANTAILCISMDLPFAGARFCTTEGIEKVHTASAFRSPEFGENYGVLLVDGPLRGLFARAVLILDETGTVTYAELVPEITQEPDYEAALKALK